MKLLNITLCPFAGFTNHTVHFSDGLNVMFGPNELGKSTLFNAIHAALFISTNLPKNNTDYKSILPFFPLQGKHDFIAVELQFESANKLYILRKKWSDAKSVSACSLSSSDENLSTPDSVDQRLSELLKINRATWEHVLLIKQSSIGETVSRLKEQKNNIDTISHASGDQLNDIDPQKFLTAINNLLEEYNERWDAVNKKPEGGRGIENPWSKPGFIAAQWYKVESILSKAKNLKEIEQDLDNLNQEIQLVNNQLTPVIDFLNWAQPLSSSLSKRIEIDNQILQLQNQLKPLMDTIKEWQRCADTLPILQKNYDDKAVQIKLIFKESETADKRFKFQLLQNDFKKLNDLKQKIDDGKNELEKIQEISEDDYKNCLQYLDDLHHASIKMDAQQLIVELLSNENTEIQVSAGKDNPRKIQLNSQQLEQIKTSGFVSVSHQGLTITVKSGLEDIDHLKNIIQQTSSDADAFFNKYNVTGIDELKKLYHQRQQLISNQHKLNSDFQLILSGRTFEEIENQIQELASLPMTRDLNILNELQVSEKANLIQIESEIRKSRNTIEDFEKKYTSLDDLNNELLQKNSNKLLLEQSLNTLDPLPEGYKNAADFQLKIQQYQKQKDELKEKQNTLLQQKNLLELNSKDEEYSLPEYREKYTLENDRIKQLYKESKVLERLRNRCVVLISEQKIDPFEEVRADIILYLKELTNEKYTSFIDDHGVPTDITSDQAEITIPASSLSVGMRGSLAIALRLAFAKKYMHDMYGFLLMDDPLTELDEERSLLASRVISSFAQQKQVILMTCDKDHARLFEHAHTIKYTQA
jgi:exonuclease SbcC